MINDIIKIEAKHAYTKFPKKSIILGTGEDTFGIVSWTVIDVIEGIPVTDIYDNITVTGYYEEEIEYGKTYTILAKESEHEKYGVQYELLFIGEIINFASIKNQKSFLKTFLTDGQIEEMFKVLDDPLDIIQRHDIESLKKVHGIGDYISERIIERYEDCKDYCNVYLELDGLGLTPKFIQRLIGKYNNPNKIIDVVKNNPYQLSYDIEGIGFKTADKIALNNGMSPKSINRIKGFINYLLEELGEAGDSYIYADELTEYIYDELGGKDEILEFYYDENDNRIGNNIGTAIGELQEENILVLEDNEVRSERRVYLNKYYKLEEEIVYHLKRITGGENKFEFGDWQELIKIQEEEQGWEFNKKQIEGVETCLEKQITYITGCAGCVDCDTEYFNGTKWKKISEYKYKDKVLQYNKNGSSELIEPLEYHKYPSEYLWHFETKYGLDQCLSDEHNVYYMTSKNNLYHKTFKEVRENHNNKGFLGKFITTFNYEGEGLPYNEWEIRLKVAIKADGSFKNKYKPFECYVNVKKQRKKNRIESLLQKNNINYEIINIAEGYNTYKFIYLDNEKTFTDKWYQCTKEQFKIIFDEIFYWDGRYKEKNEYFTCIKSDADFIQFVGSVCGYKSTIQTLNRLKQKYKTCGKIYERKSIDYAVIFTKRNLIGLCRDKRQDHTKTPITQYKTLDGYKYCFTVPSGMLVLRRNNKIFITGNSGKTSVLSGALQALRCYEGKYSFAQTSLAGKAAARMQEITGEEGYTIHRLLGYNPSIGFTYNENNPLPYDIIILDEISLIGGEIFLSLIKAIPTDSKLIILGDMGQLPSIGCLNLAQDLYKSEYISTVELLEIHRQADKSGIIVASQAVRKSEPLFKRNFEGTMTIGELKDMHFDVNSNKDVIRSKAMDYFKRYWDSELIYDIMDIQILAPVKERGDASVFNLNLDVQEYINPHHKNKKEYKIQYDKEKHFYLREGDKVLNIKNSKNLFNIQGDKIQIFNGWTGILTKLDFTMSNATVYFPIINDSIIFNFSDLKKHILLGYTSTVHKFEGSSCKVIIGVLDYSTPPNMRTKELLYTSITRAEKECVYVVQNKAFDDAIQVSGVLNKNTFLLELLDAV